MVIDSHVLLWWLADEGKLSATARKHLAGIGGSDSEFIVSPVTFWELRLKEIRGQLSLRRPIHEWPAILRRAENVRIADIGPEIWILSAEMEWSHRDPADRLIAATALHFGMPVLTKDQRFHDPDCPVKAVW